MSESASGHVVGAASIWVLGQVAGPRRAATVLHAGRNAVYVDVAGSCIGVLARRAEQVPCGVRTDVVALPPVGDGDEVAVGDGSVALPGCEVLVTTIVDTTVPVLTPAAAAWGAARLADVAEAPLRRIREALPARALDQLAGADAHAVRALLGLGPGLTPLGDDVLSGWLATAVACRRAGLAEVRAAVTRAASQRTTTLSATLLACAARGEAVPELRALLSGIATQDETVVDEAVQLLHRVGETSGDGLLLGASLAVGGVE